MRECTFYFLRSFFHRLRRSKARKRSDVANRPIVLRFPRLVACCLLDRPQHPTTTLRFPGRLRRHLPPPTPHLASQRCFSCGRVLHADMDGRTRTSKAARPRAGEARKPPNHRPGGFRLTDQQRWLLRRGVDTSTHGNFCWKPNNTRRQLTNGCCCVQQTKARLVTQREQYHMVALKTRRKRLKRRHRGNASSNPSTASSGSAAPTRV